jgi:NADPH:quinone reductase-like Zn-dependent oxidoreductase
VVVDYSPPGWEKSVLEATNNQGTDIVFEGAGGELGTTAFTVVKDGGWFRRTALRVAASRRTTLRTRNAAGSR